MNKEAYHEITKTIYNYPFRIILHKKSPFLQMPAHWHRALELSLVFIGPVNFYVGNTHRIIHKNGISIANCEEIHHSISHYEDFDNQYVGYTIQIQYQFLKMIIPQIDTIYFQLDNNEIYHLILKEMQTIYDLYKNNEQTKYIKIYAHILQLLSILVDYCQIPREIIKTDKTKNILEYIHNHYRDNILQADIANYFGFSREYLSRFFKKEIGISLKTYLTHIRLNYAVNLLIHTNHTIAFVAIDSGFNSETQFINMFKKHYHVTPGQFRKSHFHDK